MFKSKRVLKALKEITVVATNRVGLLADVAETLASRGINIDSVALEKSGKSAIVRVATPAASYARARLALKKAGLKPVEDKYLAVSLVDRPGELARLSRKLAQNGIRIENVFLLKREKRKTILSLKVSDFASARKILNL
ncbi:MAG: ACT domain-containing protein [Candidatus Micrarchaeia archaeon]